MGRKPKLARLPPEVKLYIEGLMADGRMTLTEMIADLAARWPDHARANELPSRSALGRYGPKLERRLLAVKAFSDAAASIDAHAGDKADSRSSALTAMVQQEIFDAVMNLQDAADPDVDSDARMSLLSEAARSLASLTRSSVQLKTYQAKVEADARKALLQEQREKLDAMGNKGGVTAETKAAIREALGIV